MRVAALMAAGLGFLGSPSFVVVAREPTSDDFPRNVRGEPSAREPNTKSGKRECERRMRQMARKRGQRS